MRMLLVDDSRAIRRILGKYLGEEGFDCVEAGDGQEALKQLEGRGPVECALVDWNMPVMDGLTFVQSVRADPAFKNMRLIMVTTENDDVHVRKALEAGADEYVMKPVTREMLLDKLRMLGLVEEP